MKNLKLSALAESDLADIWFYIAQESPVDADKFVDFIYDKCKTLAASPGLGVERPELAPSIRSFPIGNYVVFYRQVKAGIEIARVLSGKRDIPPLFK